MPDINRKTRVCHYPTGTGRPERVTGVSGVDAGHSAGGAVGSQHGAHPGRDRELSRQRHQQRAQRKTLPESRLVALQMFSRQNLSYLVRLSEDNLFFNDIQTHRKGRYNLPYFLMTTREKTRISFLNDILVICYAMSSSLVDTRTQFKKKKKK